jgi:hypothetical protein
MALEINETVQVDDLHSPFYGWIGIVRELVVVPKNKTQESSGGRYFRVQFKLRGNTVPAMKIPIVLMFGESKLRNAEELSLLELQHTLDIMGLGI